MICKVCGKEFELKPDHKGLETMCSTLCHPERPSLPYRGKDGMIVLREFIAYEWVPERKKKRKEKL